MSKRKPGKPCGASKANGQPCGAFAIEGSSRCFWHSDASRSQAAEARSRGGQRKARKQDEAVARLVMSAEELGPAPQSREEAQRLLGQIAQAVLVGRLDARTAHAATAAVQKAIGCMREEPKGSVHDLTDDQIVEAMLGHVARRYGLTLEEGRAALERARAEKVAASAETSTPLGGNGTRPAPHLFAVEAGD